MSITVLDHNLLNDYKVNLGVDILQEMLQLYINQSTIYLADLTEIKALSDNHLWHERCHKMKSAASSSGLVSVRHCLIEMEKLIDATVSERKQAIKELDTVNQQAITEFQQWLRET
jgi:HPt (histidine-containing phosphotransfer) domain-containing protein